MACKKDAASHIDATLACLPEIAKLGGGSRICKGGELNVQFAGSRNRNRPDFCLPDCESPRLSGARTHRKRAQDPRRPTRTWPASAARRAVRQASNGQALRTSASLRLVRRRLRSGQADRVLSLLEEEQDPDQWGHC